MRIDVSWEECGKGGAWCSLSGIYLDSPSLGENGNIVNGVYVIWSELEKRVVRVGSGNLKTRIGEHQRAEWAEKDTSLKVTFTQIDDEKIMLGVETYLGYVFDPIVIGERYPDIIPVGVNLPNNGISPANREYPKDGVSNYSFMQQLFQAEYIKWAGKRGRNI